MASRASRSPRGLHTASDEAPHMTSTTPPMATAEAPNSQPVTVSR